MSVPSLQIVGVIASNYVILCYQAIIKPLKSIKANRLELFNEYLIFSMTVMLTTFTEFVDNNQQRYDMGQIQIYILAIYILTNLLFILKDIVHSLSLFYQKYRTIKDRNDKIVHIKPVIMTDEEMAQWDKEIAENKIKNQIKQY